MTMMQPGQQSVQIASGQYVQNPQMQPRLLYIIYFHFEQM